jgi:hypothetical protein
MLPTKFRLIRLSSFKGEDFLEIDPLTFHIVIFSSETPQPNELKLDYEASMEDPL